MQYHDSLISKKNGGRSDTKAVFVKLWLHDIKDDINLDTIFSEAFRFLLLERYGVLFKLNKLLQPKFHRRQNQVFFLQLKNQVERIKIR